MVNILSTLKKKVKFAPLVDVILETVDEHGVVVATEKCQAYVTQPEGCEQEDESFDMFMIPYFQCAYELFNAIPGAPIFSGKKCNGPLASAMKKKEVTAKKSSSTTATTLFVEMSKRSKLKNKRGLHRPKSIPGRTTAEQLRQRLADRDQKTVFEKYLEHERKKQVAQHDAEHAKIVSGPLYLIPATNVMDDSSSSYEPEQSSDVDTKPETNETETNVSENDISEKYQPKEDEQEEDVNEVVHPDSIDLIDLSLNPEVSKRSEEPEERDEEASSPMHRDLSESSAATDMATTSLRRVSSKQGSHRPEKIDFSARKWALSGNPELEQAGSAAEKSQNADSILEDILADSSDEKIGSVGSNASISSE